MDAQLVALIVWVLVGAVAGWLAGMVVKGGGFGLVGDIIVGIVGDLVGGWLLPRLGISFGTGIVPAIVTAAIGAIVVLVLLKLLKRA